MRKRIWLLWERNDQKHRKEVLKVKRWVLKLKRKSGRRGRIGPACFCLYALRNKQTKKTLTGICGNKVFVNSSWWIDEFIYSGERGKKIYSLAQISEVWCDKSELNDPLFLVNSSKVWGPFLIRVLGSKWLGQPRTYLMLLWFLPSPEPVELGNLINDLFTTLPFKICIYRKSG